MLANGMNIIVRSFFIFLIAFLWTSYLFSGFVLAFLVAFLITLLINCVMGIFQSRRNEKQKLSRKEQSERSLYIMQLAFLTLEESLALLASAFEKKDMVVTKRKAFIALSSGDKLFPFFHRELTIECVVGAMRATQGRVIIMANQIPMQVRAWIHSLDADVIALNAQEVYDQILRPADVMPRIFFNPKSRAKLNMAAFKEMMLNKGRTRSYIMIGIVILFTSLLVRFPLYYIIFATALFGLATVSYFIPEKTGRIFS